MTYALPMARGTVGLSYVPEDISFALPEGGCPDSCAECSGCAEPAGCPGSCSDCPGCNGAGADPSADFGGQAGYELAGWLVAGLIGAALSSRASGPRRW